MHSTQDHIDRPKVGWGRLFGGPKLGPSDGFGFIFLIMRGTLARGVIIQVLASENLQAKHLQTSRRLKDFINVQKGEARQIEQESQEGQEEEAR